MLPNQSIVRGDFDPAPSSRITRVPRPQSCISWNNKNNAKLHDWKTSFNFFPGRTRTKDKYRIVYSDHQRLELEKEFNYSRYITIRRKAELANSVGLSERQVKIPQTIILHFNNKTNVQWEWNSREGLSNTSLEMGNKMQARCDFLFGRFLSSRC